jgi:Ca2+-binding RTX toxin-like protein
MAKLTINGLFFTSDLSANPAWSLSPTLKGPGFVGLWEDHYFLNMRLLGDIAIGANGEVSGTVNSLVLTGPEYATDVYRIDELSVDAAALLNLLVASKGPKDMLAYLLGGDDTIVGTGVANRLTGFAGNDTILAGAGDDTILGNAGNDHIDGGTGWDTVIYNAAFSNFQVARSGTDVSVTDLKGNGGADLLSNVEQVWFDDKIALLNVAVDNHGGSVFRMYQAALDRTPDLNGLVFWISQANAGVKLETIANAFIKSSEYQSLYGTGMSNHDLVGKYYEHILHRAADQGGLDFWTGVLDNKQASSAQVLTAISESAENVQGTAALIAQPLVFDVPVHTF